MPGLNRVPHAPNDRHGAGHVSLLRCDSVRFDGRGLRLGEHDPFEPDVTSTDRLGERLDQFGVHVHLRGGFLEFRRGPAGPGRLEVDDAEHAVGQNDEVDPAQQVGTARQRRSTDFFLDSQCRAGRVARGDCSPRAPTDPDVRD